MSGQATCPICGKRFTPWRGKKFCSEAHRKQAENRRLRGDETPIKGMIPDAQNQPSQTIDIVEEKKAVRGDESPAAIVGRAKWVACNEITQRLARDGRASTDDHSHALGWAMRIERTVDVMPDDPKLSGQVVKGAWYGCVKDERGDWSFGPTTLARAQRAVEAYLKHEDFQKQESEKSWRGNCRDLVVGGKPQP
jgi:hypothetical protein